MTYDILFIVSRLRSGGPSTQLRFIIENMDSSCFRPSILTLSPEDSKTALPEFESLGVPVDSLSLSRYEGLLKGVTRVREQVRQREPDILHTQGLRPDLLSGFAINNTIRISTARNYPYDDYPMKYGGIRGYPAAWAHLRAFRRLKTTVACSSSIMNDLAQHDIDAQVIHNGVDTSRYHPIDHDQKRTLRRKLNLSSNRDIYISVGSLIQRKKPEIVLRGFLNSSVSEEAQLVMLGDGPLRDNCESVVSQCPESQVSFRGFVDNVQEYLQASDYFISASLSEGLPNTVLEALASGLPVALSNIGPHQEAVQPGRVGVLFDTNSVSSLAEGINRLRELDEGVLSQEARQAACNHFSAEKMSSDYQSMYKSLINGEWEKA